MSQIITFSADKSFANDLDNLIEKSGYQNRSRFIRDASLFFSEIQQRGELNNMKDEVVLEGHLIIHYQHHNSVESKLMEIRHSNDIEISTTNHSCLSHTCVDIIQAIGSASNFRTVIEQLQNTPNVNKISFISAPLREEGCC
jgi:metal-responsive CopG/Arc/MetJ family transcriptional regulator